MKIYAVRKGTKYLDYSASFKAPYANTALFPTRKDAAYEISCAVSEENEKKCEVVEVELKEVEGK